MKDAGASELLVGTLVLVSSVVGVQAQEVAGSTDTTGRTASLFAIDPATAPTGVTLSAVSPTALDVYWTPGTPWDCIFDHWDVQIVGAGTTPAGCTSLTSRAITTCTATGLTPDTQYQMRVLERCLNPAANSPWSVPSSPVSTLPDSPPIFVDGFESGDAGAWAAP